MFLFWVLNVSNKEPSQISVIEMSAHKSPTIVSDLRCYIHNENILPNKALILVRSRDSPWASILFGFIKSTLNIYPSQIGHRDWNVTLYYSSRNIMAVYQNNYVINQKTYVISDLRSKLIQLISHSHSVHPWN